MLADVGTRARIVCVLTILREDCPHADQLFTESADSACKVRAVSTQLSSRAIGPVRLIAILAAAAFVVAACGADSESEPSVTRSATSTAAADAAGTDNAVPEQLQFTAKTLDGADFSGESLLGKPTVLWFWAPWCATCQREAPMVGQIAGENPDVTFVGVAAQDQLPAMQEFVDKFPVEGFSHLADADASVWAKFGVTHQPAYAFVSSDGSVDVVKGSLSEDELSERVTALPNQ